MTYTPVIQKPAVNLHATVAPPAPQKQDIELKTKQAMKCFMQMTCEQAQILASPEFSALIQGIKMMGEPSGGYMGNMNQGLGFLMVMASPVWGVVRVGVGLPGTVIGAVGTAISGIGIPVEKAIQAAQKAGSPSDARLQREHLTNVFIERLQAILSCYSYPRQCSLRKNPEELMYFGALCVAFLSRNADKGILKVGNDNLKLEMLSKQDDVVKEYFRHVNEIKEAVKSLNLDDKDDQHAWNYLMTSIENLDKGELGKLSTVEQETLGMIMEYVVKFGQLAISDSYFRKVWNQKYPEFI